MRVYGFKKSTLVLGLAALLSSSALAQDAVADFYRGKTVTIQVGFAPGGGYDLYARLAADHLGRFIPGEPGIFVENIPGAGGRLAVQNLYVNAPRDGTVLSMVVQSVAMDSAIGAIPGDIDASEFHTIGRMTSNYELGLVWSASGVKTLDDARNRSVATASTGAGSPSSYVPALLNAIEGTQYDIIQGYEGVGASRLALESGEVDAIVVGIASLRSTNPEWLTDGVVAPIWQLSMTPHPDFPDVPAIGQLGDTEEEQAVFKVIAGSADVGRSFITTPGVPDERVAALRIAFDAMMQDQTFLADAATRNLELDPLSGATLAEIFAQQMNISDAAADMTRQYVMGH